MTKKEGLKKRTDTYFRGENGGRKGTAPFSLPDLQDLREKGAVPHF